MRWTGHIGEKRNAYNIFERRSERKRSLRRPRLRKEYDIKMKIKETWCECVNLIKLAQELKQSQNCCKIGNRSSGLVHCTEVLD
jgi:hypothetical protein